MNNNCNICLISFQSSWHLNRHKNRKTPCKQPIVNDTLGIVTQTLPEPYPNVIQNINKNKNKNKNTKIKCNECNSIFSFYSGLSRHKNNLRCKKMNNKEKNKIIKKTNNIVTKNTNNINNSTINSNNTINNNINNINNSINNITININPFGKENLDSLKRADKIKILNKLYLALPAALHKIHYDIPENRNFYLANKKNTKYITTFNGKNKIFKKSNQIKNKICSKIMSHLEEWFNTYQLKLLKNKKKELSKLFASYYNGELDDKYFDEIEMFLLSYSNDIKDNVDATIKKIKIEKVKQSLEKQTTTVIDETIEDVD
jgi:hypothetical protein